MSKRDWVEKRERMWRISSFGRERKVVIVTNQESVRAMRCRIQDELRCN